MSLEPCRVLCADPPWSFEDEGAGAKRADEKGAVHQYKVLGVEDIIRFPLPPIADNAALFLWRVSSQVEEAYQVVRAWGFKPKTEIVWEKTTPCRKCSMQGYTAHPLTQTPGEWTKIWCDECGGRGGKPSFGQGHYTRAAHETCIVATRGRFVVKDKAIRSRFSAHVGEHSEKPEYFYKEIVEKLSGAGPYTELFGRRKRHGWTVLGDDVGLGENMIQMGAVPLRMVYLAPLSTPAEPTTIANQAPAAAAAAAPTSTPQVADVTMMTFYCGNCGTIQDKAIKPGDFAPVCLDCKSTMSRNKPNRPPTIDKPLWIRRALQDGVLKDNETSSVDAAWAILLERAPANWWSSFDGEKPSAADRTLPLMDHKPWCRALDLQPCTCDRPPVDQNTGLPKEQPATVATPAIAPHMENLSELAMQLEMKRAKVTLPEVAAWTPAQRDEARAWLAGGKKPDFFKLKRGAAPKTQENGHTNGVNGTVQQKPFSRAPSMWDICEAVAENCFDPEGGAEV